MKKFVSTILLITIFILSLCGCVNSEEKSDGLQIICTAFPQYDYIKNILGSESGLTLLLDDGADLHSYEPTAQDIIKIGSADLFVYIGGYSDSWVEGALKSANNPNLKTVALMDLVDTYDVEYVAGMEHSHGEHNDAHEGDHSEEDEHIWLSLKNASVITQKLCDVICEIEPVKAEQYKSNAAEFIGNLNNLDTDYQSVIESAKRKTLLFADRFPFRYMTEDYGIEYFAAFAGCSSESEASFKTMAFLIDKTNELELPYVIIIDGSDGSIADMICNSSNAKKLTLDSCQSVSIDDIKDGTSYIGIMQKNLNVLREALN